MDFDDTFCDKNSLSIIVDVFMFGNLDGKRVDSNYTFTADSEKMTVEITYSFDGSALGGKNLVTFEELYDMSNPKEPVKVAEHKDINDDGQTVLITERIIKIQTTEIGRAHV